MKVLVTGGAGFIGSVVCQRLLQETIEPVVFDRRNRAHHLSVELGDVRDYASVREAVGRCDGVIHLAAILGTQETMDDPWAVVDVNVNGALNVFKACATHKRRCVYITVGNHWMQNPYAISKTTAERFAWMYNKEHGTQIAVVRAMNAYGPGQKAAPVRKIIPNFVQPALRDEVLQVYGDGSQIMDMLYVYDLADILVRALTVDHGNFETCFSAGTGRRTTVQEIAELVTILVGRGCIQNVPMRPGEPPGSVVLGDPETLRPLYGGEVPPLTQLEEGLKRTIHPLEVW